MGAVTSIPAGAAFIFSSVADNIAYDTINAYVVVVVGPGYGNWQVWKGDETQSGSGATQLGTCTYSDSSVTTHMCSFGLGASAAQMVTFVCPASGNNPCLFYAAEGTNGTVGVSVSPLAMASSSAEIYNPSSSFAFINLIPGGVQAFVTNYGTNEYPRVTARLLSNPRCRTSSPTRKRSRRVS